MSFTGMGITSIILAALVVFVSVLIYGLIRVWMMKTEAKNLYAKNDVAGLFLAFADRNNAQAPRYVAKMNISFEEIKDIIGPLVRSKEHLSRATVFLFNIETYRLRP